jgi:cysteine desulfurase/selenocysteine lyase
MLSKIDLQPRTSTLSCDLARRDFGRRALGLAALLGTGRDWLVPDAAAAVARPVGAWREDFPALDRGMPASKVIYLDSAATTQRPRPVLAAMTAFYENDNANPGQALHARARSAYERYEAARARIARFLNATHNDEVVWVRGTTEGVNVVAHAWARARLRPGDEILLTAAEHASNMLPWQLAASATGARVVYVDVDPDGRISLADLRRKLNSRTRLLAFGHVSNVAGYVNPAAEICALAKKAGARVFVDAAQSVPHFAVDVRAIGCDFLAFSSHKMLGPMGTGVVWVRREMFDEMVPFQSGAKMAHAVGLHEREWSALAHRFEAGTPNVAGAVGLGAAVEYLDSIGRIEVERHERQLCEHALEKLLAIPGLELHGPRSPERRIPVFSFSLSGTAPDELARRLDEAGVAIRAGDLAALPLLRRFGVDSAARASCYLYSTHDDIDRLAAELRSADLRNRP